MVVVVERGHNISFFISLIFDYYTFLSLFFYYIPSQLFVKIFFMFLFQVSKIFSFCLPKN